MTKFRDTTSYSPLQMEGALCAWEQMLEWHDSTAKSKLPEFRKLIDKLWEEHGTSAMRHVSMQAGSICNNVYKHMESQQWGFASSYDWEFVPGVLARLDWNALITDNQYHGVPYEPDIAAIFLSMVEADKARHVDHPERREFVDEWMTKARRAAKDLWGYPELLDDHAEFVAESRARKDDPEAVVKWLGEKYDLTPRSEWERGY